MGSQGVVTPIDSAQTPPTEVKIFDHLFWALTLDLSLLTHDLNDTFHQCAVRRLTSPKFGLDHFDLDLDPVVDVCTESMGAGVTTPWVTLITTTPS